MFMRWFRFKTMVVFDQLKKYIFNRQVPNIQISLLSLKFLVIQKMNKNKMRQRKKVIRSNVVNATLNLITGKGMTYLTLNNTSIKQRSCYTIRTFPFPVHPSITRRSAELCLLSYSFSRPVHFAGTSFLANASSQSFFGS